MDDLISILLKVGNGPLKEDMDMAVFCSEKEISQKFADMIQRNYVPSLESIS